MKTALRSLLVFVLVLLSGAAPAETWPTRPIKFVVPFGPESQAAVPHQIDPGRRE
jgi:tripartite-type tricarboxylate transporter receptor subunit TctC